MSETSIYLPRYESSWALIIGINNYEKCSPLGYACNDACATTALLVSKLGFPAENLTQLNDRQASKASILASFLGFADTRKVRPDDRLFVFFAGHGLTRTGRRGEVGYLVPADGDPDDINTLIRWDELTRNGDLIPAKHILFIMDACYGGLAVTRYVAPGSMRFLTDMLKRYSRQVLTAGKANEVVADAGGPRRGHSVFTGHLLDALEGAAASADNVITANGVMAYVYDRVAKDQHSHQTPHFGFIDGDGDFVFTMPAGEETPEGREKEHDTLVAVPPALAEQAGTPATQEPIAALKEYLSEAKYRIKLDDLTNTEVRRTVTLLGRESFPLHTTAEVTPQQFAERLKSYEIAIARLQAMTAVLGRWADASQRRILEKPFARLSEANAMRAGNYLWLELRWHPVLLLLYAGGIGALYGENYENLAAIFATSVAADVREDRSILLAVADSMLELVQREAFKVLPGHQRQHTPRSEYMFKALQPGLEDVLFLGRSYETLFDRFELLLALVCADLRERANLSFWGPIGRFGWKYFLGGENPISQLKKEAARLTDRWPPIQAGLFDGSYARFERATNQFEEKVGKLGWY